jgi:8-oxo-dGTP diphosphatase
MEWKRYLGGYGLLVKGRQVLLVGNDFGDGTLRWGLPGGNLDPGEAFEEAVVREVLEETGLVVRAVQLRYITEHIGSSIYWLTFTYEVEELGGELGVFQDPDKVIRSVRWVPFDELPNLISDPSILEPLAKACEESELPLWHEVWRKD